MRKTNISLLVAIISILPLVQFAVSGGLPESNVTLTLNNTGIIRSEGSSVSYMIYQSAGTNYIQNASTGLNVYSSSSVVSTFSTAFRLVSSGGKITVFPATYTVTTSHIEMTGVTNVTVAFEPGAVLTISNGLDVTVLELVNCVNCTLINPQINGNGLNQNTPWLTDGILFYDCSGCLAVNASITNCYRDGFAISDDVAGNQPNGIVNSTITFCGWNGMTLGAGGLDTIGAYAINNTVAYCSDVGITNYGVGNRIIGNYIHDMNGTTNTKAHWGIGVEANGYDLIANNTIVNSGTGISIAPDTSHFVQSNFVIYNDIVNCSTGICVADTGYDTVTHNRVTNWGSGYAFGIMLYWGQNYIVSYNTINSNSVYEAKSIYCYNVANAFIFNNTITTVTTPAYSYGVYVEAGVNTTMIEGNNVQALYGVVIHTSNCINNKISQNSLGNCTTAITNSGTGTIINPSSSNSYTFALNNPSVHGSVSPSVGTHSYSNTSQVLITLTPNTNYNSVLNVDGVNVNLANNTYILSMNSDHTVYAIFATSEGET
jgi:hypothetical protein